MRVSGIIPAAGCSSRAGYFKMTRQLLGKPVIEHVIDTMNTVCDDIIVVTGYQKEKLSYLQNRYDNLRLLYNEDYSAGMFTSVMTGVNAFSGDIAVICPGDCPAVGSGTYLKLTEYDYGVRVPFYKGIPGHPVCIRKDYIKRLQKGNYSTLKEFINSCKVCCVQVDDPAILMDIDYPADFDSIKKYLMGIRCGSYVQPV